MFLISSCRCRCPIHLIQVFSIEWRCRRSLAQRRCSKYIWAISDFIAYWGAAYITGFSVPMSPGIFRLQYQKGNILRSEQKWLPPVDGFYTRIFLDYSSFYKSSSTAHTTPHQLAYFMISERPDAYFFIFHQIFLCSSSQGDNVLLNYVDICWRTSNGSWCIGIKGEMSGTVCVTFTWDIYIYMSCL